MLMIGMLSVVMPSVIMLSGIMLTVIMLSVVALFSQPKSHFINTDNREYKFYTLCRCFKTFNKLECLSTATFFSGPPNICKIGYIKMH